MAPTMIKYGPLKEGPDFIPSHVSRIPKPKPPAPPSLTFWGFIRQTNLHLFFLIIAVFVSLHYLKSQIQVPEYVRPERADLIDPSRNPLLEYVRIRSRRLGYDLTEAEEYCKAGTRLDNCALDWERILVEVPKLMVLKNVTNTTGIHCIHRHVETTCFDTNFHAGHQTVWTQKLELSSESWQMEVSHEERFYPKMILAHSPIEFILISDTEHFCHLNLLDNECLHYDY